MALCRLRLLKASEWALRWTTRAAHFSSVPSRRWQPTCGRSRAAAEPVRGERVIGWAAHYLVGVTFAGVLLAICGLAWARQPTLVPALVLGIATVAAPFLLMQPGMGAGIAARRTPRPNAARLQSFATHTVFGLGLYAAGLVLKLLSGE